MRPALIATPTFVFTALALAGAAQALPTMPPRDTSASLQSPAVLPVRYHRHHHHVWRNPSPVMSHAARGDSGIKPGQWQFTSELQAPASASGTQSSAPASKLAAAQPQPQPSQTDSGARTTYMACITSDKAIPAGIDPRCKLDDTQRQGSRISWSMSCANTHVRSDGIAQYHGDTMGGTMISHVPNASGAAMDLTQRITGHYVGPCTQSAQMQMPPAQMMQAANEAGSSQPQAAQQPVEPANAASQHAGRETDVREPPHERHAAHRHARYRHYARHHHRRHHWRWY